MERNRSVEGFPSDGVEVVDGDNGERLRELGVPGVKGVVLQKRAGSLWPWRLVVWVLVCIFCVWFLSWCWCWCACVRMLAGVCVMNKGWESGGLGFSANESRASCVKSRDSIFRPTRRSPRSRNENKSGKLSQTEEQSRSDG